MKGVAVSPILGSSVGKYRNGCDGSTFIRLTACAKPHLKHSEEQEMPILKMPHQRNKTAFIPLCRIILLEMWGLKDICGCKYSRYKNAIKEGIKVEGHVCNESGF